MSKQIHFHQHSPFLYALFLLILALPLIGPRASHAQGQGPLARIAAPSKEQSVRGSVTILGTAQSDALVRYELAFAQEPDLASWVVFGGGTQTVNSSTLGIWNTRPLQDGKYALRLQVFSSNGAVIETIVRNLELTNGTGTASADGAATPANGQVSALPSDAEPSSSSTSRAISNFSFSDIPVAFMRGVRLAAYAFVALGVYVLLKAALRMLRKRVSHTPIDYGS